MAAPPPWVASLLSCTPSEQWLAVPVETSSGLVGQM
jgi:hypothetical protein